MFNICKKCRKKKSKKLQINLETEKIISYVKKEYGLRVYLNIYHLTIFNYILQFFGFGFFHTSLEINDIEYSFKLGSGDQSGIFYNHFKDGIDKKRLKEKIYLGNTPYDINSVNEIFKLYIPFWLGRSYNLFEKNCNNFTKFFASLLLRTDNVINYPDYVNRITIFARYFNMLYNPIKKLYIELNSTLTTSPLNSEFLPNENNNNNINENMNMNYQMNNYEPKLNENNTSSNNNSSQSIKKLDSINIYHKSNIIVNNFINLFGPNKTNISLFDNYKYEANKYFPVGNLIFNHVDSQTDLQTRLSSNMFNYTSKPSTTSFNGNKVIDNDIEFPLKMNNNVNIMNTITKK